MTHNPPQPPRLPNPFTAIEAVETFQKSFNWFFDTLIRQRERLYSELEFTVEEKLFGKIERLHGMKSFLDYCGNPEQQFPSIHVAGTSGKGSTTMMINDLLLGAGYKTAHHTSPYFQSPTEKLVYNGRWEDPAYCVELFQDFDRLHKGWIASQDEFGPIRYGSAWVWLTFWWMAKRQVEWGVVETGVGGRFDPTVWLTPRVTVITNIAMDHVKSLGPTLHDIARHKAGIFKPNTPAVVGVTQPDILAVFEQEAADQNAPLYRLGHEFDFEVINPKTNTITVQTPKRIYERVTVGAQGEYQLNNAVLALVAVEVALESTLPQQSLDYFAKTTYLGRMEVMPDNQLILLDGAHNPHKMAATVRSVLKKYPGKNIVAVVGGLEAKDLTQMFNQLVPHCRYMIATQPHLVGKAVNRPEVVAEMIRQIDGEIPLESYEQIADAIAVAKQVANSDDLILVTGSIYLVGQARDIWYPVEQLLLESVVQPFNR
ncbi:MAG: dihydrofolate synthase/folylpolyglutamate synthase, partial [Candidatus Promineifilaceae bacterium]